MKIILKNIKELQRTSFDYKEDDSMANLQESLENYGQIIPFIILSNGLIIDGNKRHKIYQRIGHEKIYCIEIKKELTDLQMISIKLSLDKSISEINDLKLANEIKILKDKYGLKKLEENLPLDNTEIINSLNLMDFKWKEKQSAIQKTIFD